MQLQQRLREGRRREPSPAYTSVSQLKEYLRCPRKYFFHYIEGEEREFRSVALCFGTAWHHAIGEVLLRRPADMPVEEVREIFRDALAAEVQGEDDEDGVPVLFDTDEQTLPALIDRGIAMLDVFLARVTLPDNVLGVEVAFVVELADPTTWEMLPVPLVGSIDALLQEGTETVVLELKTAAKRWSPDQLEHDIQPSAYRLGAQSLGHPDPLLRLVVTTKGEKPDVQVEDLLRGRRDERELAGIVAGVTRAVAAGADHRIRGWWCRSCEYVGACGA